MLTGVIVLGVAVLVALVVIVLAAYRAHTAGRRRRQAALVVQVAEARLAALERAAVFELLELARRGRRP